MTRIRRATTAALTVLAAAAGGLAAAPTAGAGTSGLAWTACGPRLECADVTVPLDWDEPHGRTLTMPVMRRLASHPERRIGSLFVQPGGPGDSAIETVQSRGEKLDTLTGGRFDIVGWDIRGAGGTARVDCFGSEAARAAFWKGKTLPTTRAEQRAHMAVSADFARRCVERNGDLLRHVSTADTARDLDHLRRLVGDAGLTYFGESYGTYLGQTYANMFPRRVRAMVLDGNTDPVAVARGTASSIAAGLGSTDDVVAKFAALCEQAGPERCALAGHGQPVLERINGVFDRLRQGPLPAPNASVPGELTLGEATGALKYATLAHPVIWPLAAGALEAAAEGDGSYVEEEALFNQSELFHRFVEPGQAITCADSPARQTPAQWPAVVRRLARISEIGGISLGFGMGAACTSWPLAEDRYTGPWTATTKNPVLILNNRWEPNSPLANARKVDRLLGNSVLLVHDGYGHLSVNDPSVCVDRAMGRYLTRLVTPPKGTHCASDRLPFDPAFGS